MYHLLKAYYIMLPYVPRSHGQMGINSVYVDAVERVKLVWAFLALRLLLLIFAETQHLQTKEALSWTTHFEKVSLNFSSLPIPILLNLYYLKPALILLSLLFHLWCFSILVSFRSFYPIIATKSAELLSSFEANTAGSAKSVIWDCSNCIIPSALVE